MATETLRQSLDRDMLRSVTKSMAGDGRPHGRSKRGGRGRSALGELPSNDQQQREARKEAREGSEDRHADDVRALVVKERQMRHKIHKMELNEAARLEMQVQNINIKKNSLRAREEDAAAGIPHATPRKGEFDRDVTSDGKPIYSFEQGTPGGMCVYFLKGFCCLGNKCRYVHDEADDGRYVKITGMPYDIDVDAVIKFFAPLRVPRESITFIEGKDGKPSGSAIVEFKDRKEALIAQHKDRAHITPARYVLLYPSSGKEREWHKQNADKERARRKAVVAAQAAMAPPALVASPNMDAHAYGGSPTGMMAQPPHIAMGAMGMGQMLSPSAGGGVPHAMPPQYRQGSMSTSPFGTFSGSSSAMSPSPAAALMAMQQQQQMQHTMPPLPSNQLLAPQQHQPPPHHMNPMAAAHGFAADMDHAHDQHSAALAAELSAVNHALLAQLQTSDMGPSVMAAELQVLPPPHVHVEAEVEMHEAVPPLVPTEPQPAAQPAELTPRKAAAQAAAGTPQSEGGPQPQAGQGVPYYRSLATPMTAPSKSLLAQKLQGFGCSGYTPATQPRPVAYQPASVLHTATASPVAAAGAASRQPTPKKEAGGADDTMRNLLSTLEEADHDHDAHGGAKAAGGVLAMPPLMQMPRSASGSVATTPNDSPRGGRAGRGDTPLIPSLVESFMQLDATTRNAILKSIQEASGAQEAKGGGEAAQQVEDMPTLLPLAQ